MGKWETGKDGSLKLVPLVWKWLILSISIRLNVLCGGTKHSSWPVTMIQTCTQWCLSCFRSCVWSFSDQESINAQIKTRLAVWVRLYEPVDKGSQFRRIKEAELSTWSTTQGTQGAFCRVRIGNCNRERHRESIMSYVTSEGTSITAALECQRLIALMLT